jgi:hypothetical protein
LKTFFTAHSLCEDIGLPVAAQRVRAQAQFTFEMASSGFAEKKLAKVQNVQQRLGEDIAKESKQSFSVNQHLYLLEIC